MALIITLPIVLLCGGVQVGVGQCPELVPYQLVPADWPCPVIPVCSTQYGICRLPYVASSGQPCYCRAADGQWIRGVCIRGSQGF